MACRGLGGEQATRACPLSMQQQPALHDLVLEPEHLVDQGGILRRDRVDRLDPGDEVVETACAEDHRQGGLLLIRGVDRDEPFLERSLRLGEIATGHAECLAIDDELTLDRRKLLVRRLVSAVRPLGRRVELLQPRLHGLGLRTLCADLIRASTRGRRPE